MKTGLDRLVEEDFESVRGKRVGLLTHFAALDQRQRSALHLFAESRQCQLRAVFGPEHGISGEAQDLIPVGDGSNAGLRVHSLYGEEFASLKPTRDMLRDLDLFLVDLVDVGSRYYTFQASMLYCMEACAEVGLPVLILDRPNPLGRTVEGPSLVSGFESFVGVHPICTRHGMTIGELAKLYQAERVPGCRLTVLPMEADPTVEQPTWTLPPSPNMPTQTTAWVYPGMCLIEGTNLSEGRGTTRPFEYVGHPDVSPRQLADRLNGDGLPGVTFVPTSFQPTFQKHAGRSCGGVFLVPSAGFQPVRTGLAVVIAFRDLLGSAFQWRTERYEFVDHIPAIDLLFGSDRERKQIEAGVLWPEIVRQWEPEESGFCERRKPHLLY